jgi:hypothetical protein
VPFNIVMETDSQRAKTVAICELARTLRNQGCSFVETIDS